MAEGGRRVYCGQCGNPLHEGSTFCGSRGAAVLPLPPQAEQVIPESTATSQGTVTSGRGRTLARATRMGVLSCRWGPGHWLPLSSTTGWASWAVQTLDGSRSRKNPRCLGLLRQERAPGRLDNDGRRAATATPRRSGERDGQPKDLARRSPVARSSVKTTSSIGGR